VTSSEELDGGKAKQQRKEITSGTINTSSTFRSDEEVNMGG